MPKLPAYVRILHPFPGALVVITSGAFAIVAHRGVPPPAVMLRVLFVVLQSQIAVGALNDYADRERDLRVQPDKPIPAGEASAAVTLLIAVVSALLGVAVSATFGPASFAVVAVGIGASLAYDVCLKATPLSFVGYVIGFLSLVTWIWLVAGRLTPGFALIYIPGSLLVTAAHLAQSLPDVETDRRLKLRGLASLLGARRTFMLIIRLSVLLIACALILAVLYRSPVAAAAAAAAALLTCAAWRTGDGGRHLGHSAALRVFHLIAPALALLGLAILAAGPWTQGL
jgi:4-hydroxybenzoate polyprenyltransferase